MELTHQKITLYRRTMLGYTKVECTKWSHAVRKYAQYESAVEVRFVPVRKRKPRYFMETSHPSTIILEGHGHPDPDSAWGEAEVSENGVVSHTARHSGFSPEWDNEFNTKIDRYLAESSAKVLLDLRKHNSLTPQVTVTSILNGCAA